MLETLDNLKGPPMRLVSNLKRVLCHAYSIRFLPLAGILSGLEVALPLLDGILPISPTTFPVFSALTALKETDETFMITSALLCLCLCADYTLTAKSQVVVQTQFIREKIPAALIAPTCAKAWSKKDGPEITDDFVARGDVNEGGLTYREAKLEGIRQWNAGQE
ncbi:hypothetical protein ASD50_04035 [Mesorhizobium sp. Root552]|nr:hypothetical protein ASD50_04035 [Mesorhizobium sp. Root552]